MCGLRRKQKETGNEKNKVCMLSFVGKRPDEKQDFLRGFCTQLLRLEEGKNDMV